MPSEQRGAGLDERRVGLAIAEDRSRISYEDRALVARLVGEALMEGGLGARNKEAPLADIIAPGMTVLLKPNWVLHYNKSRMGMDCMVTHPRFIEAVLEEVAKAGPGRIVIADAPIQSTAFDLLVPESWKAKIRAAAPCRVDFVDLRKSIWRTDRWSRRIEPGTREDRDYVLFDLGPLSLLEPITIPGVQFRNTCYHPDALAAAHEPGRHRYLLCREIFDADVVINLPKLKSHRKAGLTAALKNLVGVNGDKDFLPHHRLGGSARGGDCYEGNALVKSLAERCYDNANRRINRPGYLAWEKCGLAFLKLSEILTGNSELEGGWRGNDTLWRMVLDLNRIALYGRTDGSLSETPLRRIYSLTDAVVAGENFGPLAPEPVNLGAVTFASSSAFADLAHAALMRFDWRRIPSVRNAFGAYPYPLASGRPEEVDLRLAGRSLSMAALASERGLDFRPARGWRGHIEIEDGRPSGQRLP